MFVEKAFVRGILRDAYHQLSEESKHSSVGSLLWTSHGVDHLFLLGSLVLILASFGLCMDLIAWRKGNEKVIVATMFLIAYFMVNFCAIGLPIIPGEFAFFPVNDSNGLEARADTASCILEYAYWKKG